MDFKIIWSDAAIADFQEIWTYLAQRDPAAALRNGRGLLDHIRILASFPFIGPNYPRGVKGTLREIVFGSYRIFYDVGETTRTVEILHIWHGARENPPR